MPAFFCELFSEEIPARMQAGGADELERLVCNELAALGPEHVCKYYGPRRIALAAELSTSIVISVTKERGPRVNAPEQAINGFLKKHNASREMLVEQDGFLMLDKVSEPRTAAQIIASAMPKIIYRFSWPKSMRWGGTSALTWVRPLRRIVCILDGKVVDFSLRRGTDDGHGLSAGALTEGHRSWPGSPFTVTGHVQWRAELEERGVMVAAEDREGFIETHLAEKARDLQVTLIRDFSLIREVAGLVEWPVILAGRIDEEYMDLPPEAMQVSMRINQRYFATRSYSGEVAPYFLFVANMVAPDGGAAIVAGNERVLRARFADARHFWDLDRRTKLADRVAALDGVVFHASLGSQGARVARLVALARVLAPMVGAEIALAERAALLAKADLTTGMVGEFPELQGVMGGYYARHDREADAVADAVRDHYSPKGPGDAVPTAPVSVAVALADKIDQLVAFFAAGERPTGSGDPYALRRAALGVIRILRDNGLRVKLRDVLRAAGDGVAGGAAVVDEVLAFVAERLRVQLRGEGARHDVLAAVFAAGADDDLVRLLARSDAVAALLGSADGADLLAAYKRAANILRIEERRDGPHESAADAGLLQEPEEIALHDALGAAGAADALIAAERFGDAMAVLAGLRAPLDAFFAKVTVNADDAALRTNRLRLLAGVRRAMNAVADFAAIES